MILTNKGVGLNIQQCELEVCAGKKGGVFES